MGEHEKSTAEHDDEPTLSKEQFRRLAAYGQAQSVSEGDLLYATGDTRYDLFLLDTAEVDVVRDSTATEPEHLVYSRGPGEFLGELNLLTGQAVFLTAKVRSAGDVVRLDANRFRRVLSEQSDIADVLIEALRIRRQIMVEAARSALEIVGERDDSRTRALRAFATRLTLPHCAADADSVCGQALMAANGISEDDLPAAIIAGDILRNTTPGDIAEVLGLTYSEGDDDVDLVVIGAGPAGLAAAVYGASEGLVTVLLDSTGPGGQAATSSRIENYLGFPQGISGEDLTKLAMVQAMKFGAQLYSPCEVVKLHTADESGLVVTLHDGAEIRTRAVIVATGAQYRRLDVPGWADFEKSGSIRYSATELDSRGCESRPVTVVGGANSAGQAALFLASKGAHVDVVIRGDKLENGMSSYLADRVVAHPDIEVWTGHVVSALRGDKRLDEITVTGHDGKEQTLASNALFCFIGAAPSADWLEGLDKDDDGFILTDRALSDPGLPFQTSIPRVFAAGDIRSGSMKRVAAAVGEGASAVASVHQALAEVEQESDQARAQSDDKG